MTNVYRLRPDNISNDTVKCLSQLHTLAKRGLVKGIGFVAYIEDQEYIANTAGEAYNDPHNTQAMLLALLRKLGRRIDNTDA